MPATPAALMSSAVSTASTPLALRAASAFTASDAGMRMRRAHEGGIGLVRQPRVVHEAAIAAHQGVVLDARLVFAMGEGEFMRFSRRKIAARL